jgi:methylglyoxal synthase
MNQERRKIPDQKRIALIAHDGMKREMLEWALWNKPTLSGHLLFATASTGELIHKETGLPVTCFKSGPLGGDQQIGSRIAEGELDMLIFFWDPLEPQPHDPDVKALLRIAVLHNIPTASNRATADFLISSQFMNQSYEQILPDFTAKIHRRG